MKWFHIKMLQLCMVLAQGALTVFCDPVEDLETRERLARQPAQFVRLEYMQIAQGKEQPTWRRRENGHPFMRPS